MGVFLRGRGVQRPISHYGAAGTVPINQTSRELAPSRTQGGRGRRKMFRVCVSICETQGPTGKLNVLPTDLETMCASESEAGNHARAQVPAHDDAYPHPGGQSWASSPCGRTQKNPKGLKEHAV